MANSGYRVLVPKNVAREVRRLPVQERKAVYEAIEALSRNPRPTGSARLKVRDLGEFRIRVRGYRVRYDVDDAGRCVHILAIKPRGEAYRV